MPPATTTSAEPALIRSWPSITAFMPEPQTLLMVVQPADVGMPAASAAWRAGAWPRPAGSTQPMITSSTLRRPATPDCSSAARMAVAPSVGGGHAGELAEEGTDGGALGTDDDDVGHGGSGQWMPRGYGAGAGD